MDYPLANTYGVRSELFLQTADDYHRHRHRTNRKLNKLRRSLNIVTKDTKNYKDKEKTSSIVAENYDMDTAFGDVLLYLVERDLLYAQETRLLLDVHSSKQRERFLVTKYKKALKHGKQLIGVLGNEQDPLKVLEVITYVAIIEGLLAVTKKKYDISLYAFSIARCALQYLYNYQQLPSQYTKELYYDIMDLVVDPALKVSALQVNGARAAGISNLAELSKEQVFNNEFIPYLYRAVQIIKDGNAAYVTPSNESETKLLDEISWGSYTAKIQSDDLALAIMKVNKEVADVVDSDATTYDAPLISYQDAIGVHTQDMERAANAGDDDDYESGNQEQYIILTYLKYNYLLLRVRRDYTIMNELDAKSEEAAKDAKLSKQKLLELWKDYLKVNDTILSSLNEVKELPGIANDDDVMDFLTSVDNFFIVKKQMKLSQAYLVENKYMESLALIANALTILDETKPFATTSEGNLPNNDSLKNLKENVESERAKAFTLTQYFNNQKSESRVGSEYLIDNVDRFPEVTGTELLKKIAPAGIDFQPVNAKPVLFDIAYNYIKYPGEVDSISGAVSADAGAGAHSVSTTKVADYNEEPVREDVVEEGEKKKSGFFGLFGR